MKKSLLLILAVFIGFAVIAQHYTLKPNLKTESAITPNRIAAEPVKAFHPGQNIMGITPQCNNKNTNTINIITLGSAANGYTYGYGGGQRSLVFADNEINTVTNIHRMGGILDPGGYSGDLAYDISTDGGTTWTTMHEIYRAVNNAGGSFYTDAARYPQHGIYNPVGNTNPNNAYVTYWSPTLDGSNYPGSFGGYAFGRAKIGTPTDTIRHLKASRPGDGVFQYTPDGYCVTKTGEVWVADFNQNWTSGTIAYQNSMIINHGVWNAALNDFVYEEMIIACPTINGLLPSNLKIEFSPDGMTGYIVAIGDNGQVPISAGLSYFPLIYKTTDGGQTWSDQMAVALAGPGGITDVQNFLSDTEIAELYQAPVPARDEIPFTTAYDFDLSVDASGNPHIAVIVGVTGSGSYQIITTPSTNSELLYCAAMDITSPDGGNSWIAYECGRTYSFRGIFPDNSYSEDNRIQITHNPDRTKMFVSWIDTHVPGITNNNQPDIYCRGIDLITQSLSRNNGESTPKNVTENSEAMWKAFMASVSNEALENNGDYTIPMTYLSTGSNMFDPAAPVVFKYIQDFKFTNADFLEGLSITPNNRNVTAIAGSTTFMVFSGTAWTVSDDASWLSVSPTNGINNDTLIATYDENTSSTARIANITITAADLPPVYVTVTQAGTGTLSFDSLALVSLYNATNGTNWTNNTNWLTGPVNTWYGITVNEGFVSEIRLYGNQLSGSIPPEIGNFTNLQTLYLSTNQLSGSIPPEIGNLVNLQTLYLFYNQVSGSIPPEIGNLGSLQSLDLSNNQLNGSMPPEIGNLTNLQGLWLSDNQLSGSIPLEITYLINIQTLNLSNNLFGGSIPQEIGNLTNLQYLGAAYTGLTGSIPMEIGNLTNLQYLVLDNNQLSGIIPPEIGNLMNLQWLFLYNNLLTGSIPVEIGILTNLQTLYLFNNQFSGSIPPEIGNLTNLQVLSLSNNQFSGYIPPEIGNLSNLQDLLLFSNQLSGSISIEICNIPNLSYFAFENNYFDLGSCPAIACLQSNGVNIPDGTQQNGLNLLTDCDSPLVVYPANQNVTSDDGSTSFNVNTTGVWAAESNEPWCTVTPDGEGNGTIIAMYEENTSLGTRMANITVTVVDLLPVYVTVTQAGIGNLSTDSLALVALYNATDGPNWYNNTNWLTGPVNTWYGITVSDNFVTEIYIDNNNLTGNIPQEIGNLINLQQLWLYGNQLSGSIPSQIGNLTNLNLLYLYANQLSGNIPSEIGNLSNLQNLALSDNQLSGNIPPEIGNLSNLWELTLYYNQLSGNIPPELGNLNNLQYLFLHNNQLNGSIPIEICNIPGLSYFYFENNYFGLESCPAIACLQNNGVNMYDGTQLNGLDLLTDCDSPLVVYPANQNVTAEAGTTSFNVNTSAVWAVESNKSWCTVTPDGLGNGAIAATYTESTSLGSRIANITVTAVDLPPVYVTITQTGIGNLSTDSLALVALYNATDGPNWYNNSNWLTGPVNTWYGITVSDNFVTQIYLYENNLTGSIPSEIGNLVNLNFLDFRYNQLNSNIPSEFGNLVNLQQLKLSGNQLSGNIPIDMGNMVNLIDLYLDYNQLGGSIPTEIGNLANLQDFDLSYNQLSGIIPTEIGNVTNLYYLSLSNNQLSGDIPPQIGNLANLYGLSLSNNQLSGNIPPQIGNLSNLDYLFVNNNQLSGSIPAEICNIPPLYYFEFENNYFDLGSCPAIECLTSNGVYLFDGTQLNGLNLLTDCDSPLVVSPANQNVTAEAGIASFSVNTNASWVAESNKAWCAVTPDGEGNGTITATYTENTSFGSRIANITVTAVDLPPVYVTVTQAGIGNLSTDSLALVALYTATDGSNWTNKTNWLTGPLNTWYGITVNEGFVSEINLFGNQLSGNIPPEIGNLSKLQNLYLYNNQLLGNIPPEIGNLTNLQYLDLSINQLTGSIPSEIGNLTNLQYLRLNSNQLSGSIPPEIGNLANLQFLILPYNQLSGSITPEIGNLINLQVLWLFDNQLSSNIPPEIGNLTNIQAIFLFGNQLSGSIPPEIGNLTNLYSLSLSSNQLTGSIPIEICYIPGLSYFNFENNYFDLGSCPAIACLVSNGTDMNEGYQLNGYNLLTDCVLPPAVEIGNDDDWVCADGSSYYFGNVTAQYYYQIQWSTTGSGYFDDQNLLQPTYFPSNDDYQQGSVNIGVNAVGNLGNAEDFMVLHFVSPPEVVAGTDASVNAGDSYNLTDATATIYNSLLWTTTGDGAFDEPGIVSPVYTPGFNDIIAGQVELCLLASTQFCQVTDCLTLSIISTAAISVDPLTLSQELAPNETATQTLTISNNGESTLYWNIEVNDETGKYLSGKANSKNHNIASDFGNDNSFKNLELKEQPSSSQVKDKARLLARMEADGLYSVELGMANARSGGASPTQTDDATIRYDNGVNFDAIGPTSGGTFQVAAYWPAAMMAQYTGMKLAQVEFYINTVPVPCVIKIYGPGTPTSPGTLLYEETVFPTGLTWNIFNLAEQVEITGEDLWIGYEVTHPAGEYPAGCDAGPAIAGYGDMITLDGVVWAPLSGYGLDYNWNLVGYLVEGEFWLTISPTTGIVQPGETATVDVTFDATSLVNGNYNADIILTSNAVNSPEVLIPAQLIVSGGAPDISLSTDLLEFGSVAIGSSNTQTVTVSNTGYGLLEITETTFSNPDFSLITDATTINPGESAPFEIQFAPSVTGLISGVLSISSNDPDQPDISINLAGTGYLEAPQNLIANVVGHNVTLTWDQPFKNPSRGLLGYNIYRDGSQIDYSSITNFTDFNVPAGGHQYQVSAVYDEGESELTPAVSVLVGTAIIAVNPDLFEESLAIGASVSREIMITNTGDLPLTLDINLGSSKNLTTTDENTPEAWEKLKERMDADGLSGIELGIANARPGGASPTQTDDATVRYDNGVNFEAIGPTSGGTFQVAAYWPAATMAQYAGMKLQKVEMYINSVPSTCKIMVYGQGTPTSPGTLLYEETVFTVGLSWNLFTLSNEVDITGQDIWIGYEVTHSAGTYPAGCDVGPAIAGFGDMITLDGVQWAPLSGYGLDYNWNLAAYLITGGPAPTNDVGVQTILSPITGLNLSNETVKIRVKNFGTASQSNIPVSYTIDGGAAVTGTVAGPLASGATFDYTFAGAANLGTVGQTYVFNACTALAGDEIPGNNCKAASVTNELPIYCDASTTTQDEYISNVLFGSINNSSGWQGGVSDYTAISTTIEAGASEAMTIINGTPWASDIVYVWVDWNKDYVFGTGDEQYILSNIGGTGALFTGSVAVPVGQASGHYRMRIRMTYSTAPTPCGNASYGEIEDYTLVVEGVANWLTLNPTAGTIQPGESATVDVTFDATNLANGVYNTDITINSNAINAPQVIIPAQLTVSGGVPNISLSVGSLDFGTLKVGGTTTQTVAVSNTGYDVLEIIEATFSNPDFSLITGASTINPGESAPFEIIFAPSVTGLISGILTISSNDPDQTEVTIDLSGSAYLEVPQNLIANVVGHDVTLTWDHPFKDTSRGLLGYNIYRDGSLIGYSTITNYTDFNVSVGSHQYQVSAVYDEGESELTPAVSVLVGSPIIEVNPVSFEEYLAIETSITREMMVTNSGDLPLTFAVNTGYNRNFKTINENSEDELGNHKKSKVLGEPQIIKLGSANTKPGGPSPYQTDEATIRYDNNVNFDAIGLVYGGTFEVASLFPAVTMAQYAGLKLSKLEFYIKDLPNQCVIKIYGPGSGTTPGSLLYSEAVIAVGLSWNIINLSIPVDITGQDLWIGYEVTHDENTYPAGHDPGPAVAGFGDMIYIEGTWAPLSSYELNYNWNLAGYLIETPLNWLIVSPTSGTLLPGESATVDVTFNASNLTPDVYTAKINISSNDPNTPLIEIPVQLTVQTDETHVISINQGWSGISSYLIPTDSDVESILQPIISDLTILQSGTGIYWPDQNVNTIGSWDTHHGYMIKVANAVDLTITGVSENDRTLFLSEGWNLIPILSNYEVDVETLFNGINLEILKEVAGVRIYWPSMNVKSLNFVEPGKAYFLKMSSPDSITFPVKSLVATPQNPEVTAVASELTIEITSNTSWSVIENVAWFSVSPVSGSNNGTITVTFDENTSSSRVGQITITAAGGAPVVNVTLTQAGVWACGQTLNDTRDSKTYTTVQIGTQCWMAQNLNIGTMVPGGNEMVDDGTVEKYCYDNSEANCDVYGGLYQWDEMMEYSTAIGVQGICPTGWHLPSDAEWTALTTCLGGEDVAGGKMKETGTIEEGTGLWWSPNYVATNSSGFSALPGGSRYYDGALFSSIGYTGYWWSSTEVSITFARDRYLNNNLANVYGNDSDKGYGISVRCLRDASTTSTTPTVTTTSISNITQTTATSGGDVTSDGGAMVTERGVCWSTNANPTIADNRTFDGEGMGVFESNITDLAANTLFFVRAYATNNVGTAYGEEVSFTTLAGSGSTCGTSIIINHVAGDVAPVYKTVTYGIVTNIPGEPSKCWITSNLGADHQATTVSDATEPSAGWYWQFNRKQGYKHTGSVRTPNTTWISSISENSNWISTNDPCTLELGSGWRIPSYTEWSNVNSFGNWTNWNDPWNSDLKIHAAGYLNDSDGSMPGRGVLGLYWSSAQSGVTYGQFLVFMVGAGNSGMSWDPKARGIPLRCLRD